MAVGLINAGSWGPLALLAAKISSNLCSGVRLAKQEGVCIMEGGMEYIIIQKERWEK